MFNMLPYHIVRNVQYIWIQDDGRRDNNVMGICLEKVKEWLSTMMPGPRYHIAGRRLRITREIATGGYGTVLEVQDVETRQRFAMKRMICQTKEQCSLYQNEISTLKALLHAKHVIKYHGSYEIKRDGFQQGYILLQLASRTLCDMLEEDISEEAMLGVIREVCVGLQQMHGVGLVHSDVKIENILQVRGVWKVGDLGSATRQKINLRQASKQQLYIHEERFSRETTLMYRPPQMVDIYLKYEIGQKADVWMLGCVVYLLCFKVHPFSEMSKLAIVNAYVKYPNKGKIQQLIRNMLTPHPSYRISLSQIIKYIDEWETCEVQLNTIAAIIQNNELMEEKGIYQKEEWRDIQ